MEPFQTFLLQYWVAAFTCIKLGNMTCSNLLQYYTKIAN